MSESDNVGQETSKDQNITRQDIDQALKLLGVSCANGTKPEDRLRFERLAIRAWQLGHNRQASHGDAPSESLREDGELDRATLNALLHETGPRLGLASGNLAMRGSPFEPSYTENGCTVPHLPARADEPPARKR